MNQNSTTNFFPTTQTTATIIGRTNDSNILLGISYLVILLVYIYGGLKVTFLKKKYNNGNISQRRQNVLINSKIEGGYISK